MVYGRGSGTPRWSQLVLARRREPSPIYNNDLTALMWAAATATRAR